MSVTTSTKHAAKKARKAAKKAAKLAAAAAAAAAAAQENNDDEEDVKMTDSSTSTKKKKKKSKRKREETVVEQQQQQQEEQTASSSSSPKKPKKQNKKSSSSSTVQFDFSELLTSSSASTAFESKEIHVSEFTGDGDEEVKILAPMMVHKFTHVSFSAELANAFTSFKQPTPIQKHTWPYLLSGRDVIGIAATGSGKTLGFAVPGMVHLLRNRVHKSPRMLVVAPTRELARQIHEVCEEVGKQCGVTALCVYGGVSKYEQVRALRSRVDIVIGTPGRMLDLAQQGALRLDECTYVVLDEADRMLDMGFEADIRALLGQTASVRQTLLYSATWPTEIQQLGRSFMRTPVKVTIGSEELSASHSVEQVVELVKPFGKDRRLTALLEQYHSTRDNRIIVFVLYKKEASRVESVLNQRGWRCVAIHGDKSQEQRQYALEQFKTGEVPLLIATDVAARGLDIPNVEYVLNYTFPLTVEDYVHRIGRTGRAGKTGLAHTLFTAEHDSKHAGALCNVLKESNQVVPPELEAFGPTITKRKEHSLYGHHFKSSNDDRPMKKSSHIKFD